MSDKKGAIEFSIAYIASVILLVLIIIFWSIYFSRPDLCPEQICKTESKSAAMQEPSQTMLFSILKLEYGGKQVADLLINSYEKNSKSLIAIENNGEPIAGIYEESFINKQSKQDLEIILIPILDQISSENEKWIIDVAKYPGQKTLYRIGKELSLTSPTKVSANLPLKNPDEGYLTISIWSTRNE